MFRALVSLLSEREKNEPLHAAVYIALAPIRPYIIGGSGSGQFPPDGGWEKWLDKITVEQQGDGVYYNVCKTGGSGGGTGGQAVELFCAGEDLVSKSPAKTIRYGQRSRRSMNTTDLERSNTIRPQIPTTAKGRLETTSLKLGIPRKLRRSANM